eukprot:CFRG3784T1
MLRSVTRLPFQRKSNTIILQLPQARPQALTQYHTDCKLPLAEQLFVRTDYRAKRSYTTPVLPGILVKTITSRLNYSNSRTISAHNQCFVCYQSLSSNPFSNLAFEDWVYTQWGKLNSTTADVLDLKDYVLLFWVDTPSVVIGRNQNPWTECDVASMRKDGIEFVRRKSGGGTVYHDGGNLNISLLTSRDLYTKHRLTGIIAKALNKDFALNVVVNDRNDLAIDGKKVSGSAYKLGGRCAYHHCTLLVTSDAKKVGKYLHSDKEGIDSKGVSSVRSPVSALISNLKIGRTLTIEAVVESISEGLRDHVIESKHDVSSYPLPHSSSKLEDVCIFKINPETDDQISDACEQYKQTLLNWDWQFGQTPQFTQSLFRIFPWGCAHITLACRKGIVGSFDMTIVADHSTVPEESEISITAIVKEMQTVCGTRYGDKIDAVRAMNECMVTVDSSELNVKEKRTVRDVWSWLVEVYTV